MKCKETKNGNIKFVMSKEEAELLYKLAEGNHLEQMNEDITGRAKINDSDVLNLSWSIFNAYDVLV